MRPLDRNGWPGGIRAAACLSLTALASLALGPARGLSQEGDEMTQALLNEYRSALGRLRAEHERVHLSGSVHEVMDNKDGTPPIRDHTYKIDYAANGRLEKLNEVFRLNGFLDRVYVMGERSFALRRSAEGGAYVLDQLGQLPVSFVTEFKENKNMLVNAAFSISNEAIPPLLDSPRFTVHRAARAGRGAAPVRFDFYYGAERPKEQYDMAGWFVVDPARAWSVVEYQVHRKIPALPKSEQLDMLITGKVRYPAEQGPCATFPEGVTVSFLSLVPGGRQFERRYDFQTLSCSTDPVSSSDFTLAAFGMGDLDRPASRGMNTTALWALGIAVLVAAASVVIRRLGH